MLASVNNRSGNREISDEAVRGRLPHIEIRASNVYLFFQSRSSSSSAARQVRLCPMRDERWHKRRRRFIFQRRVVAKRRTLVVDRSKTRDSLKGNHNEGVKPIDSPIALCRSVVPCV